MHTKLVIQRQKKKIAEGDDSLKVIEMPKDLTDSIPASDKSSISPSTVVSEIESVGLIIPSIKNLSSMISEIPVSDMKDNVQHRLNTLLQDIKSTIEEISEDSGNSADIFGIDSQ